MKLTDETILQRFRSGSTTFQIARNGNVGMTEGDVEAALHRAMDAEVAAAVAGGYYRDLMEARFARRLGEDAPPRFVQPDYPQRSLVTPPRCVFHGTPDERAVYLALSSPRPPES